MKQMTILTPKIKLTVLLLSIALIAAVLPVSAVPSNQTFYLDGTKVELAAHNINGNNYVQLRSLAEKLKQFGAKDNGFDVQFDQSENAVFISSNSAYTGENIDSNPTQVVSLTETTKDNYNYEELPDEDEIGELALPSPF
jgi:hypothetical protein